MKIHLGACERSKNVDKKDVQIVWEPSRLINPHVLLCGKTGTGKSYTLRRMIHDVVRSATDVRVHVFDVHGDLQDCAQGASVVRFSSQTRYGYNPLVLDANPESGGVRRQINHIISAINTTSRKIMDRQEACLRNLLTDVYAMHGIYENNPETWRKQEISEKYRNEIRHAGNFSEQKNYYPTLDDLISFAERKLKMLYGGFDLNDRGSRALAVFDEMSRAAQTLRSALTKSGKAVIDANAASDRLQKAKEKWLTCATEYMNSIETGRELDDLIKFDSKEVMKSVIDRLKNFRAIGIFNSNHPPFDYGSRIWVYDLSSLDLPEQVMFCLFRTQSLLRERMLAGSRDSIAEIIVADECQNLLSNSIDNVFNRVVLEGRKFGLAIWGASQTPSNFPEKFLATVGTKIILGIDSFYWKSCTKIGIDENTMKYIKPHQTMAVCLDRKGQTSTRYSTVIIPSNARMHVHI